MADWSIFLYALPAAIGALVFLKVVADRIAWIDAVAQIRTEERAAVAAKSTEDQHARSHAGR